MADRLTEFASVLKRRRLDLAVVKTVPNVRALTGINCDNAALVVSPRLPPVFFTDGRYLAMVRRVAPGMRTRDLRRLSLGTRGKPPRRIGYEGAISVVQFERLKALAPRAKFVDIANDLAKLRAVKTPEEIAAVRAAVELNDEIWADAKARFAAGMTEREMARIIRTMMIERGDGEAFDTIVCVGKNAAECHHEPDDTVWNGREPVLVDMGVKLNGWCSDMTRNLPGRASIYRRIHALVKRANETAIAAARPGMTGKELDRVARNVIREGGFEKCFVHSLGHGVGLEIHEAPYASKKSDWKLKPGMLVTIEPGVYLEDNLGIRIEDLVLITKDGCEVLTRSERI